jgi:hypothetical protein
MYPTPPCEGFYYLFIGKIAPYNWDSQHKIGAEHSYIITFIVVEALP